MFTICTLIYDLFILLCVLYIIIWIVPNKYIIYIFILLMINLTFFGILLHNNQQCNKYSNNINNNTIFNNTIFNNTLFNNTILDNYKPGNLKKNINL